MGVAPALDTRFVFPEDAPSKLVPHRLLCDQILDLPLAAQVSRGKLIGSDGIVWRFSVNRTFGRETCSVFPHGNPESHFALFLVLVLKQTSARGGAEGRGQSPVNPLKI